MTHNDTTILVLGATGQQGGAVSRHLMRKGWQVRAFIRDRSSDAATQLEQLGAELVVGNMENAASLAAAMAGTYGVFSVQPPTWIPNPQADAGEVRLGQLAADCAKHAGVKHLVYTSVLGAERQAEFGRTNHKREIEAHIWRIGLPATVLRPAGFMENFLLPGFGLASGSLFEPTNPDVAVSLIAVDDIGAITAKVFGEPDRFIGKTLDIAGDRQTPPRIAAMLGRALGRTISHAHVPNETVRARSETLAAMYAWLNRNGYPEVDFGALRALHPDLLTLEGWLAAGGSRKLSTHLK